MVFGRRDYPKTLMSVSFLSTVESSELPLLPDMYGGRFGPWRVMDRAQIALSGSVRRYPAQGSVDNCRSRVYSKSPSGWRSPLAEVCHQLKLDEAQ